MSELTPIDPVSIDRRVFSQLSVAAFSGTPMRVSRVASARMTPSYPMVSCITPLAGTALGNVTMASDRAIRGCCGAACHNSFQSFSIQKRGGRWSEATDTAAAPTANVMSSGHRRLHKTNTFYSRTAPHKFFSRKGRIRRREIHQKLHGYF